MGICCSNRIKPLISEEAERSITGLLFSNRNPRASKRQIMDLVTYLGKLGLLAWPKRNESEPVSGVGARKGEFEEVEIVGEHVDQSEASRSK
jgi:hypothetical protein